MQDPRRIEIERIAIGHATDQQPVILHSNQHPYFRSTRQRSYLHSQPQPPHPEYLTLTSTTQTARKVPNPKATDIEIGGTSPRPNKGTFSPSKGPVRHSGILDLRAIKQAELERGGLNTTARSFESVQRNKMNVSITKSKRICQENGAQMGLIELGGR